MANTAGAAREARVNYYPSAPIARADLVTILRHPFSSNESCRGEAMHEGRSSGLRIASSANFFTPSRSLSPTRNQWFAARAAKQFVRV